VRTLYQDTWAQQMEFLGDVFGRQIRYGEPSTDPDRPVREGGAVTRQEFLQQIVETALAIADIEAAENATGVVDDDNAVRRSLMAIRETPGLTDVP